jgi:hypothetical protein
MFDISNDRVVVLFDPGHGLSSLIQSVRSNPPRSADMTGRVGGKVAFATVPTGVRAAARRPASRHHRHPHTRDYAMVTDRYRRLSAWMRRSGTYRRSTGIPAPARLTCATSPRSRPSSTTASPSSRPPQYRRCERRDLHRADVIPDAKWHPTIKRGQASTAASASPALCQHSPNGHSGRIGPVLCPSLDRTARCLVRGPCGV